VLQDIFGDLFLTAAIQELCSVIDIVEAVGALIYRRWVFLSKAARPGSYH
jgi:hypothetical protein